MHDSVLDVALEALVLLVETIGTGATIVLGLFAERASLSTLAAGDALLGLWFACMGSLALFVGVYLLGYRRLLGRLARA
jgi:uncharacterized membrane protein